MNSRRSRISAVLLIMAVLIALTAFPTPHVIFRVPFAILAIFGLWRAKRWSFPLLWATAALWLVVFIVITPFLLIASPLDLWRPWLYWFIPTTLVIIACILMSTATGRAERATWLTSAHFVSSNTND